jgi:hypothetical protein
LDELDYDFHWQRAKAQFAIGEAHPDETFRYAEQDAQYGHSLCVFDPLRDLMTDAIQAAGRLTNANARYYMQFGAGRRLGMMFYAYRDITLTAHPQRTDPLTHPEQQDLSRDINVLYMHTRGVLDNYAWCLLYETSPEAAQKIVAEDKGRQQVDLFHPKFRSLCPAFADIERQINAHAEWNADLKQRRDPAAHRIPLYIPSSAITEEEGPIYQLLSEQHIEYAAQRRFEESDEAFDAMQALGRFMPCFVHHPDDGPIPIYPTVPTDMAHLIRISAIIEQTLLKESSDRKSP